MVFNATFGAFQLNNILKYKLLMYDLTIRLTHAFVMSSFAPCSLCWNNGLITPYDDFSLNSLQHGWWLELGGPRILILAAMRPLVQSQNVDS